MIKEHDDYKAKIGMWAKNGKVVRMPKPVGLPEFGCHRFSSPSEMNAWKEDFMAEIARRGGVKWTN